MSSNARNSHLRAKNPLMSPSGLPLNQPARASVRFPPLHFVSRKPWASAQRLISEREISEGLRKLLIRCPFPPQRCWSSILVLLGLLVCGGCGEEVPEGRLSVHPAGGKVSVKSQPAAGVFLVLHPAPGSPAARADVLPSATTEADGSFQLSTYDQNDGAPVGEYVVTLQWRQSDSQSDDQRRAMALMGQKPADRFRGKYNNPSTSPWRISITEGENVLDAIEIE